MDAAVTAQARPRRSRFDSALAGVSLLVLTLLLAHVALMATERPAVMAPPNMIATTGRFAPGIFVAPTSVPGIVTPWRHAPQMILDECPGRHVLPPGFLFLTLLVLVAAVGIGASAWQTTSSAHIAAFGLHPPPLLFAAATRRAFLQVFRN